MRARRSLGAVRSVLLRLGVEPALEVFQARAERAQLGERLALERAVALLLRRLVIASSRKPRIMSSAASAWPSGVTGLPPTKPTVVMSASAHQTPSQYVETVSVSSAAKPPPASRTNSAAAGRTQRRELRVMRQLRQRLGGSLGAGGGVGRGAGGVRRPGGVRGGGAGV